MAYKRQCAICEKTAQEKGEPVKAATAHLRALNLVGDFAHTSCLDAWAERIKRRIEASRHE